MKYKCPRCKKFTLDPSDCGESALYRSRHIICVPCFFAEDEEINREGNDLPEVLRNYGPSNEYLLDQI